MKSMKIIRDVFAAVMIGILGGFLFTTISYYNHHKEGGIFQTMMAVINSYDTVARAYGDDSSVTSVGNYDLESTVLEAFDELDEEETAALYGKLRNILSDLEEDGSEGDVLVMEGETGGIEDGEPYSGIMRFHVRANSDSDEDQELKMAVKDDVVTMLKPLLENCSSVAESKNVIVSNLQNIYTTAIDTIVEQGYDYSVKVYVTEEEFPVKTYGDLTFPAGNYQALRIDIGKAEGKNWWCVMYPPLCFIDESTTIISKDGKELLKENLTDEEYRQLFRQPDVTITPSCKIFELFEKDSF